MLTLVRRARRRFFGNELLSEGANAASAALIAFILLLLAGSEVLDWRWAALIPAAAAAAGLYRARRRLPTPYVLAQIVDRRMALADTLSTALYFSQGGRPSPVSPEMRQCQFAQAGRASEAVDVRRAIPYTMPRTAWLLAALILVASSLFALRYGLNRRLDLKPPLARILQQTFGPTPRTELARDLERNRPPAPEPQEDSDTPVDRDPRSGGESDPAADNSSDGSNQPGADKNGAAAGDPRKQGEKSEKPGEGEEEAQAGSSSEAKDSGNSGSGQQGNAKSEQKQQSGAQQDANSGQNSSLLNKVKDAFQNLLSRAKPQQGDTGQQPSAADQKGQQGKGQQAGAKQQSARNGPQQTSGQQGDSQEGQAGQDAQSSQDPQGKGTGKSDSPQASKQPGSGIGSQDGDKSIKQAEQLAAMGKITEIFGKRSANITGEATLEVNSTSQQLRTPYAPRGAQHAQSGAEIDRDEVPVALQAYVEQYFEQVRKHAPAAPPKK